MRVRVYFELDYMTTTLTPEQIEMYDTDWEELYHSLEDEIVEHAEKYLTIVEVLEI